MMVMIAAGRNPNGFGLLINADLYRLSPDDYGIQHFPAFQKLRFFAPGVPFFHHRYVGGEKLGPFRITTTVSGD
jgi:hypothetical protein